MKALFVTTTVLTVLLGVGWLFFPAASRWTGDGDYEAVVLDPEGNRIEIMA